MYCSVFTQSQKTVYCIRIWLKWPLSTSLVLNKGGVHCWALGRDPQLSGDHHTVIPSPPKLDTAIRHWVAVVVLVCGHSAPMDQAIVVVVVHHGGIVFQLLIHDSTVRRLNQPLVKLFCESNQLGPGSASAHYIIFFFTQKFLLWDVHGHSLSMLWKIFTIIQAPEITPILSPSVKWPSYFSFLQRTR